jgi:hypothetical protein
MQSPRGPVEKAGMSRMLAQPSAALTKPGPRRKPEHKNETNRCLVAIEIG